MGLAKNFQVVDDAKTDFSKVLNNACESHRCYQVASYSNKYVGSH